MAKTQIRSNDLADAGVATADIADAAVTLAKMANLAQDKLIGRATASTGVPEAITLTAAGRALIDDASAAAQRTTLGLDLEAVAALSLGTGWADTGGGFQTGRYYKDPLGIVHVEGLVTRTSGTGTTIATLPAGYRPAAKHYFASAADGAFCALIVQTDGIIKLDVGAAVFYLSLSGITFRV